MTDEKNTRAVSRDETKKLSDTDATDALDTGAGQVSSPYQNEVQADAIAKQTQKRNDPID